MNQKIFISFWAGSLEIARDLPTHLKVLYALVGHECFVRDPEVCAERELVPVGELLEPFSLCEEFTFELAKAAERQSLKMASVVVAIYTHERLRTEQLQPSDGGLRYLGTFPEP
jgi:hypothetical protein